MRSLSFQPPSTVWWTRISAIPQRTLLLGLTLLATLTRTGAYWDLQWHAVVGRDQFWIPPHTLIYGGVALAGLLSFLVVLRDGAARGWARPLPWPWLLATAGSGLLVLAAPFDDLWHGRFGIDVTIWSPPHMVGVVGTWFVQMGALVGWLGEYRRDLRRSSVLGVVWSGALLVTMLNFGIVPAVRWSVTQPAAATVYALGGSLFIPWVFVTVTYASKLRWLPLALVSGLLVLRLLDLAVHTWSIAVVVPWWGEALRRGGIGAAAINRHFWTHLALNVVPAVVVSIAAFIRPPATARWAILTGLAAGVGIVAAVLVLRTGVIIPVNRITQDRDYRAEFVPFMRVFGTSDALAWGYALVGGALSGWAGWAITHLVPRKVAVAQT